MDKAITSCSTAIVNSIISRTLRFATTNNNAIFFLFSFFLFVWFCCFYSRFNLWFISFRFFSSFCFWFGFCSNRFFNFFFSFFFFDFLLSFFLFRCRLYNFLNNWFYNFFFFSFLYSVVSFCCLS